MITKLIDRNKALEKLMYREPPVGEDNTKERYRNMQWLADVNAIKEMKPVEAILIPEEATNGDMILTMFPDIETYETVYVCGKAYVRVEFPGLPDIKVFELEWWNAPFKWKG